MLNPARRQLLKRALLVARVKLLYSRITLSPITTFYFFFALIACGILSALQAITFGDSTAGVSVLSPFIKNVSMDSVTILDPQNLQTCTSIPLQRGTTCKIKLNFSSNLSTRDDVSESLIWIRHEELDAENDANPLPDVNFGISHIPDIVSLLDDNCMTSLAWFSEVIEDGKREDVAIILGQFWLFSLALVAILNESIPHLGAALLGHGLGTGGAAVRIQTNLYMTNLYRNVAVPQACGGIDVLGNWWEIRMQHSIPILVVNVLILIAYIYLSAKLYNVYANQSFSRVGASTAIHRIYKIVLSFSVCLQLSGFFSLATIALWIDKICHGSMRELVNHSNLYLAAFPVILVFVFPWLFLGWTCVRRECKKVFAVFAGISVFLLAISTAMFFSPLYLYTFTIWPFFSSFTITAYVLVVATIVLCMICRLNFGKGLAHYLQVSDALEGVDFTPVSFSKGYDTDPEKVDCDELKGSPRTSFNPKILDLPTLSFPDPKTRPERGSSIYCEPKENPVMLSSSRPLVSEFTPPRLPPYSKAPSQRGHAPSLRGLNLTYNPQSEVDLVPTIRPNSTQSRDLLASPPRRSSSARLSPILQKYGLPRNPREGMRRES